MIQFGSFVIKESKHIVRDSRTMLILFGMPIVMMLLFGFAIRTDIKNVRTLVVGTSSDTQTGQIVQALAASEYFDIVGVVPTMPMAEQRIRHRQADIALAFSPNFASNRQKDRAIQVMSDASDPNMGQLYTNYAQSIITGVTATGHNKGYHGQDVSLVNTRMLFNPQMLSAYNFVPGIMGMLLMLICAIMTSVSIAREKEKGTMEVLLVSPVKPLVIIIAKAVPYMILAILILVSILLMSYFVLDVPLAGSLFWIFTISVIYIILSLSVGLLISNIAPSQLVALLVSAMVMLMPVVMLSGMIFPVESMPDILQWVSCVVPARWYIAAMRKLMIMGVNYQHVMKETLVLTGMTMALLTISLATFKNRLE